MAPSEKSVRAFLPYAILHHLACFFRTYFSFSATFAIGARVFVSALIAFTRSLLLPEEAERVETRFVADFAAAVLFVTVFFAAVFFAVVFAAVVLTLPADLFEAGFAAVFFAVVFFAAVLAAGFETDAFAVVFFAAAVFAVAFFTVVFFAAAFSEGSYQSSFSIIRYKILS